MKSTKLFYFLALIAAILLEVPVFFAECQLATGICCILGLLIFLLLNLYINKKHQYIFLYIIFAIAYAIRFSRVFMTSISVFLIGFAATFLVGIIIDAIFLFSNLINHSKCRVLTPLIFPLGYTFIFFLLCEIHFGNTFNLVNYFTLIAPLTYSLVWANEFILMFLILLAICLLLEIPFLPFKKKIVDGVLGAIIILSLSISGTALMVTSTNRKADYILNVALVTSEKRNFNGISEVYMSKEDYHQEFESKVKEAVSQGASLMLFQEEYFTIDLESEEEELTYFSEVLKAYNMPSLIGASIESNNGLYKNCAYYFNNTGVLISTYQKYNLIPYIETLDYEPGGSEPANFTTTIAGHTINISTVICFDINNDVFLRKLNSQTELLIVPSWDWDTGNAEQIKTYVRSIEYNTTVIKHSYDGYSYVSTPLGLYGEILDNRNSYKALKMIEVPIYKKS